MKLPGAIHTVCSNCDLEIEGLSPFPANEWRDRGNNTHCRTGGLHVPDRAEVLRLTQPARKSRLQEVKDERDAARAELSRYQLALHDAIGVRIKDTQRVAIRDPRCGANITDLYILRLTRTKHDPLIIVAHYVPNTVKGGMHARTLANVTVRRFDDYHAEVRHWLDSGRVTGTLQMLKVLDDWRAQLQRGHFDNDHYDQIGGL